MCLFYPISTDKSNKLFHVFQKCNFASSFYWKRVKVETVKARTGPQREKTMSSSCTATSEAHDELLGVVVECMKRSGRTACSPWLKWLSLCTADQQG